MCRVREIPGEVGGGGGGGGGKGFTPLSKIGRASCRERVLAMV